MARLQNKSCLADKSKSSHSSSLAQEQGQIKKILRHTIHRILYYIPRSDSGRHRDSPKGKESDRAQISQLPLCTRCHRYAKHF